MRTVATVTKRTEVAEGDEQDKLGFWALAKLVIKESPVPEYEMHRLTCYRLSISAGRWNEPVEYVAYEESPTREDALRRHAAILDGFDNEGDYPIIDPMLRGVVRKDWMDLVFKRVV